MSPSENGDNAGGESVIDPLKEALGSFTRLRAKGFAMSLSLNAPTDSDQVMKGLEVLQRSFPQLRSSSYTEETDTMRIENDEEETQKQMVVAAREGKHLLVTWGIDLEFGSDRDIKQVFESLQKDMSIRAVNVSYIDFRVIAASFWEGNHYAVMWDAFFKDGVLGSLLSADTLSDTGLVIRSQLSDDCVCFIGVDSDVGTREIRTGRFENDRLRASVGIAKLRGFAPGMDLGKTAAEHAAFSASFIADRFLPCIMKPLDDALAAAMSEGEGE